MPIKIENGVVVEAVDAELDPIIAFNAITGGGATSFAAGPLSIRDDSWAPAGSHTYRVVMGDMAFAGFVPPGDDPVASIYSVHGPTDQIAAEIKRFISYAHYLGGVARFSASRTPCAPASQPGPL